jgi:DNA repair ATPase RecN
LIKVSNIIGFIACLLLLQSCVKEAPSSPIIEESTLHIDTITLKAKTGLKPSLRLTPAAQKATKDWRTYAALAKMMEEYQEISFLDLKENVERGVGLFTQEEQAEEASVSIIPESMNTPAIKSRFLVIETRIKVLQNLLSKYDPDISAIETEMVGIQNAFQNLNLQINERFEKSVEELLEELRKEQKANNVTPSSQNLQGRPPLSASQQF